MEFEIRTDLTVIPKNIDFNYDELKQELRQQLEFYNNLVVNENEIAAAKSDRARLNKLIKAIEDKRKEVKKQCLEPYTDFEVKCKEIVNLIQEPVRAIDMQIKSFDDKKAEQKYKYIKEAFNSFCAVDYISLEKIINPKWKNSSLKADTVIEELKQKIVAVTSDMQTIEMQYGGAPFFAAVKQHFIACYDLGDTVRYAESLKAVSQTQESVSQTQIVNDTSESEKPVTGQVSDTSERVISGTFFVEGTAKQIKALGNFMRANNIKFSIVKE